jgi:hypothetical protein
MAAKRVDWGTLGRHRLWRLNVGWRPIETRQRPEADDGQACLRVEHGADVRIDSRGKQAGAEGSNTRAGERSAILQTSVL